MRRLQQEHRVGVVADAVRHIGATVVGHQVERQCALRGVGGHRCGRAHHVLPDHVDAQLPDQVRVQPSPDRLHLGAAEVRVVHPTAERGHAVAVRHQRRIAIGVETAVGAIGDHGREQPCARLATGSNVVQQASGFQQLPPLLEGRHFAAFVQRIVGDQRRNDGRALEPRGAQVRQHSGGVRKLCLAVGEDTVIVLEIDVDVQAIQRDPRLAVGLCNAF